MSNKNSDYYFLRGGGEMGELIRAKDWSKTSLGDLVGWPQSLRTTLSIILNSKFPMFLFWGPELICFYNDAYRPSLGNNGKHPNILGGKGEVFWAEIWKDIKPIIDTVLGGGEANWSEDQLLPICRNGKMEDVYWTFSYSPVMDESGGPAGVFVTCSETTSKVVALRDLKESNQRFRNTMQQAPVGITILRGSEYIVEMANDAYLRLVDRKEAEFVGNPLFTSLPEVEETVHSLLDNVLNTGVPYHGNEVPVPIKRHGKQKVFYFDFLYCPLKEEDGKITGVIVAVTEVTEKVEARKKIEDSEKRYNLMLMQSPFAFLILKGKDMVVHLVNESMKEVLGKGSDIEGKPLLEVLPEIKGQAFPDLLDNVYKTGVPFSANEMLAQLIRNGKLEDIYLNYVYQPYYEADNTISGVTVIAYDTTSSVIANKKIEVSEEKLNIVIEASELGTWELNLITKEPTYSKRYLEILGGYQEDIQLTHAQLLQH